jgi:nicotinate-nucleotide adenylyltransferase
VEAKPLRIALFGGTFDPPHVGHLHIASAAADRFALDRIFFAPTGRQPLKPEPPAAFADRLAMTELACQADPRFTAIDLDAPRPGGPNYTIESLSALAYLHPSATIFHIGGADSFLTLPQWRNPARLLTFAEWIVVSRPGSMLSQDEVRAVLAEALKAEPTAGQLARIHLLDGIHEPVSSTDLRRRLRAGEDVSAMLPAAVAEYIRRHGLYRAAPPTG